MFIARSGRSFYWKVVDNFLNILLNKYFVTLVCPQWNMYFSFLNKVSVTDWGDIKEGVHNVVLLVYYGSSLL